MFFEVEGQVFNSDFVAGIAKTSEYCDEIEEDIPCIRIVTDAKTYQLAFEIPNGTPYEDVYRETLKATDRRDECYARICELLGIKTKETV